MYILLCFGLHAEAEIRIVHVNEEIYLEDGVSVIEVCESDSACEQCCSYLDELDSETSKLAASHPTHPYLNGDRYFRVSISNFYPYLFYFGINKVPVSIIIAPMEYGKSDVIGFPLGFPTHYNYVLKKGLLSKKSYKSAIKQLSNNYY